MGDIQKKFAGWKLYTGILLELQVCHSTLIFRPVKKGRCKITVYGILNDAFVKFMMSGKLLQRLMMEATLIHQNPYIFLHYGIFKYTAKILWMIKDTELKFLANHGVFPGRECTGGRNTFPVALYTDKNSSGRRCNLPAIHPLREKSVSLLTISKEQYIQPFECRTQSLGRSICFLQTQHLKDSVRD